MRGAGESKRDGKRANVMLASARAGRHQHTTWHMTGHTTWHTALKPAIHAAIPTGIRAHHCLPLPLCLAVSLPPAHRHRPSARGRQWSRHASRLMPSDTRPDRSAYSFAPPHTPHAHAQARQRRLRLCSCSHTHTHTHHKQTQRGAYFKDVREILHINRDSRRQSNPVVTVTHGPTNASACRGKRGLTSPRKESDLSMSLSASVSLLLSHQF